MFFACLRGKPITLRCCFPLFPRRVARERGSPFPRKFTPFRLRCASCGTVVPLNVTLGKSVILPRFITLFWVQRHAAARLTRKNSLFPHSFARFTSLIRKMRTPHFRGNARKMRFCFALLHFFGCSVTLLAATHDEREAVSSCISRALSSRSGLRAHFTFLLWQKHFIFARKICSHIARSYPRKNFTLCVLNT